MESKEITLGNYIEEKIKKSWKNKTYFIFNWKHYFGIMDFNWFIYFYLLLFPNNLFFAIELVWFLSYRFLKTVQNPKMRTEYSTFCQII